MYLIFARSWGAGSHWVNVICKRDTYTGGINSNKIKMKIILWPWKQNKKLDNKSS